MSLPVAPIEPTAASPWVVQQLPWVHDDLGLLYVAVRGRVVGAAALVRPGDGRGPDGAAVLELIHVAPGFRGTNGPLAPLVATIRARHPDLTFNAHLGPAGDEARQRPHASRAARPDESAEPGRARAGAVTSVLERARAEHRGRVLLAFARAALVTSSARGRDEDEA